MNATNFLAKVNAIDWSKVKHAYGPADNMPNLFEVLLQGTAEEREKAWYELYGNLWHQGTIYEATGHAVPLFIDLLRIPETPEKHKVLVYLAALFFGRGYWSVHARPGSAPSDLETQLKNEAEWVAAVQSQVAGGAGVYLSLLNDSKVPTRISAAYVLGLIRVEEVDDVVVVEEIAGVGL